MPQVRTHQSSTPGASLTLPIPVVPREAWAGVEDRTVAEVTRGSSYKMLQLRKKVPLGSGPWAAIPRLVSASLPSDGLNPIY